MTILEVELGTGDVFLYLFWFALWVAWIVAVVLVFVSMMRSRDLPGWGKAIWAALILLVPIVGVMLYLCFRGAKVDDATTPGVTWYHETSEPRPGPGPGPGRQVADLARLRDEGVITQSEFENLRDRAHA